MYEYFFTFRSVTAAMKARQALEEAGIRATLARTPKTLQQQGCGYSLRVRTQNLHETKELLQRKETGFQKIYRKVANDRWQEVEL